MQLNPEQESIARHVFGRMLALAGPGSGKTRTLTERTGRLIRSGIAPASILCITFTNKARNEMRQRLAASLGQAADSVYVSNFHGLCGTILRRLGKPLGYSERLTIIDSDDQTDLLLQIARRRGLEPSRPAARTMAWVCNQWREDDANPDKLAATADGRLTRAEMNVVRSYVELLRERNQCDFSGLLSESVRLLRSESGASQRLQGRFRFIQVDEYQDTNRAQNEIVELITGQEDNLLAVGDADQSIYEWRGASPDAIGRFIDSGKAKTGTCAVVKLGLNYRSSPQVIATADRLIRHCQGRIPVDFAAMRADGELPKCGRFETPEHEAEAVAGGIANLIRQSGMPPREIAVFFRTNDMSRLIEQSLARRQIACQVVGTGSYYDRMEVRDILSMLRFVCNPRDGIAFHRIANKPARGMGDALIGKIETYADQHGIDLLAAMSPVHVRQIRGDDSRPLGEAAIRAAAAALEIFGTSTAGRSVAHLARELVGKSNYDRWLDERYEKTELEDRRRNVAELLNSIAQFSHQSPRASIADYLQSISLYTDAETDPRDQDAVRLMSLHASKGLEFDVVYMIGVEQGILPHDKAISDRGQRGLDEERRLCYVGFTRSRGILRVSWCGSRPSTYAAGKTPRMKPARPSRFLLESGLMNAEEFDAATASARQVNPGSSPSSPPSPT